MRIFNFSNVNEMDYKNIWKNGCKQIAQTVKHEMFT